MKLIFHPFMKYDLACSTFQKLNFTLIHSLTIAMITTSFQTFAG